MEVFSLWRRFPCGGVFLVLGSGAGSHLLGSRTLSDDPTLCGYLAVAIFVRSLSSHSRHQLARIEACC